MPTIELDDTLYTALQVHAQTLGEQPEVLACQLLRRQLMGTHGAHSEMFQRNQEAFYRMLPALLQTHEGQFVAFYNSELVGIGGDRIALLKEMYAQHGYNEILVTQVARTRRVRQITYRQTVRPR